MVDPTSVPGSDDVAGFVSVFVAGVLPASRVVTACSRLHEIIANITSATATVFFICMVPKQKRPASLAGRMNVSSTAELLLLLVRLALLDDLGFGDRGFGSHSVDDRI